MIQMMVFDMAGTTVNEDNLVYRSLHRVLTDAGYHFSLEETLIHGAGKGKLQAFLDILALISPESPNSVAVELHRTFKKELTAAYHHAPIRGFSGVEQVFQTLKSKGVKVVLNTGYDAATAKLLLGKLGWKEKGYLDLLVTRDDVPRGRPFPDMIFLAMDKLGIKDAGYVGKIGDSAVDIEEGKSAGCGLTVGITTGAQNRQQLEEAAPDLVIDGIADLLLVPQLQ